MAEHFEQDGSKLYATGTWGSRSARLQLSADDRASPPADLLRTQAVVRRRMGIDQQPIDVATDHGTHLVQASVWADQADRLERVRAAIQEVRHDSPELLQGDYVELLPTLLAQREHDALTVVFETASRLYLPVEARIRLRAAVEALLDAERPALVDRLPRAEAVAPELMSELSTLAHPPRVVAVFRRADLPRGVEPATGLALQHVADPGNVGTLIRTADALGPAFVALSPGR